MFRKKGSVEKYQYTKAFPSIAQQVC